MKAISFLFYGNHSSEKSKISNKLFGKDIFTSSEHQTFSFHRSNCKALNINDSSLVINAIITPDNLTSDPASEVDETEVILPFVALGSIKIAVLCIAANMDLHYLHEEIRKFENNVEEISFDHIVAVVTRLDNIKSSEINRLKTGYENEIKSLREKGDSKNSIEKIFFADSIDFKEEIIDKTNVILESYLSVSKNFDFPNSNKNSPNSKQNFFPDDHSSESLDSSRSNEQKRFKERSKSDEFEEYKSVIRREYEKKIKNLELQLQTERALHEKEMEDLKKKLTEEFQEKIQEIEDERKEDRLSAQAQIEDIRLGARQEYDIKMQKIEKHMMGEIMKLQKELQEERNKNVVATRQFPEKKYNTDRDVDPGIGPCIDCHEMIPNKNYGYRFCPFDNHLSCSVCTYTFFKTIKEDDDNPSFYCKHCQKAYTFNKGDLKHKISKA